MTTTVVTGNGPAGLRILAARIKVADAELKKDMRRNFRREAGPLVRVLQASALSLPAVKYPAAGLRPEVAASIRPASTTTRDGIRLDIIADRRKMPPSKGNLPEHMDSVRGWAHPVYARGPRRKWHWSKRRQHSRAGWFEQPVRDRQRRLTAAVQRAIDDTAATLEKPL